VLSSRASGKRARWQFSKERDDLTATRLARDDNAALAIDTMHLEDVFGEIQADRHDIHAGPHR